MTVHSVGDKKSAPNKERNDTRLYKGDLNLKVTPPFDRAQLERVQECLARVPSLKVLSKGGYAKGDEWVMMYTVDLKQPMPILKILKAMPPVGDVAEHEGNVAITLKSAATPFRDRQPGVTPLATP